MQISETKLQLLFVLPSLHHISLHILQFTDKTNKICLRFKHCRHSEFMFSGNSVAAAPQFHAGTVGVLETVKMGLGYVLCPVT
jgi:hypothetical protein